MATEPRRSIKLLIEYDGTGYEGWQSQKSRNTIQDVLTSTIRGITGEEIKLIGASRTDAGVHALGQVAVFNTGSGLPAAVLKRALNAKLPQDIRVISSEDTEASFHPRFRALKKRYFYLIQLGSDDSAFMQKYLCRIKAHLDSAAMQRAAAILEGEHDFSSFRGAGCSAKSPVRTVHSIEVRSLDSLHFMSAPIAGEFIKITMEANAFLRHMARNIAGTLIETGRGRIDPASMHDILVARDRTQAGPTAPANGLFLERVFY